MSSFQKNIFTKQQIFFCIFSVFFFLFLLCGDWIVTRFIPVNPNQEYFLNSKLEQDDLIEISLEEAFHLILSEEQINLLFIEKEKINSVEKMKHLESLYFVDLNTIHQDEKTFLTFREKIPEIKLEQSSFFYLQNVELKEKYEVVSEKNDTIKES